MLGHKRHREDEKSDENSLSNRNNINEKKNFNANFLMKLYQILETPELSSIIEWGENGKFFKVKNITEFTEKVLPKFFKHNNFASFVRQLNMYDFHKKRTYNNENIFLHKSFIRGQKNLIKTIKRKNTNNNNINETTKVDGGDLMESYQKELSSKKLTKQNLEKILLGFNKHLEMCNERQKALELKYEELEKKSEEYYIQNQNLMHEIATRSEWTKKLEAIIYLIFDYMKSKIIKNESNPSRSAIISANNNENNYIAQIADKKEFKSKAQNDSSRANSTFYKTYNENPYENYFLKNLVENLFEYVTEQNSKDKLFNKIDSYPMLNERESRPILEQFDIDRLNQQNNVFYLNKAGELVKNISKSSFRDETLNSLFNNSSNSNNNFNNVLAKFHSGNGSSIFKVENDNKKNFALTDANTNQVLNNTSNGSNKIFNAESNGNLNVNVNKSKGKLIPASNSNFNVTNNGEIGSNNTAIFEKNTNSNLNAENPNLNLCSNINNNNLINNLNNSNNNLFRDLSNCSNLGAIHCLNDPKRDALTLGLNEEDKSIFQRSYKSPNPFEDYSFGHHSNIFNSPNPMEGIMYKLPNENTEKMNMNFDLSRNSSIDYNEIFKTGTPDNIEEKKLPKENNLFFDDSFFSISSNEKKSEAVSESVKKMKNLE